MKFNVKKNLNTKWGAIIFIEVIMYLFDAYDSV